MTTDGGGWTLVWQHTYMKYSPLYTKMFYYSDYYQPCVKDASYEEWCNVPNKASFNPTEQMIVAYHKGTIVFAYKSYFNRNIDYHWTGAILLDAKKVVDRCLINNGVPTAPSVHVTGILILVSRLIKRLPPTTIITAILIIEDPHRQVRPSVVGMTVTFHLPSAPNMALI